MQEYRCAFNATQVGGHFGCRQAMHVTRRGGPDVACRAAESAARCEALFNRLKAVVLPALDYVDDLESTPHSVYVKIQFGGLLALQRAAGTEAGGERVEDIHALVTNLASRFGPIDSVPCETALEAVRRCKLPTRRSRK